MRPHVADPAARRVLYNATSARVGGGLSYSRDQVAALAAIDGVELTLLVSPWNREALEPAASDGVTVRLVRIPNAGARFLWEQLGLPWLARAHDILISPGNFGSLVCPVPQVVVLQNPNYVGAGRRLPQNAPWRRRAKIALSHLSMRRADLVVSISQSLSAEISDEPGLFGIRLATVRSGAPAPAETVDADFGPDDALGVPEPYLLSVANDYPHKRLDDLAHLARLRDEAHAEGAPPIVLAGEVTGERQEEMRRIAGPAADDLVFLGSVAERSAVLDLYRRAEVAVSTSELEAWPLTLHEARSQGAPLVLSDIPPHRELAEGQAVFYPVGQIDALARSVEEAIGSPRPGTWSMDRPWAEHGRELVEHLSRLVAPAAGGSSSGPRVALFQPVLAHYRVPLFEAFQEAVGGGLVLFSAATRTPSGVADAGATATVPRRPAPTHRWGPVWFVPGALSEVWSRRWDVVVLSWNARQLELLPALLLGRLRGVPVILWGQGLGARSSGTALALRRWQARTAAAVVTYSDQGRRDVLALAPDQTIRVMLNTTGRPTPDSDDALSSVAHRIAYIGRLEPRKHIGRLLQALSRDECAGLALDIVGSGSEGARLRLEAERLGVADRVRWHGEVLKWDAVLAVLKGCDLVVVPSHAGLVVVDGFAASRGAVVLDDASLNPPEAALVMDGETGFRYSSPSPEGLAECLARAYADPDGLREISERCGAFYRDRLGLGSAAATFGDLVAELTSEEDDARLSR